MDDPDHPVPLLEDCRTFASSRLRVADAGNDAPGVPERIVIDLASLAALADEELHEPLYQCHACWRRFPEAQLTVVNEPLGRGYRCVDCLQRVVELPN